MRLLRPSREAEMVALFLRTELPAPRFRDKLQELLKRDGLPERVITDPDLDDDAENQARLQLLTQHREYGTRTGLFDGFPDDVRWQWMAITPAELARVRYIDYDYWVELSGGTRLAADAAPRIRAGVAPFGVSSDWALGMAREVARGARFPPLILVITEPGGDLVVLEGHARLTAFMLARDRLPPELEVLVGSSPAMTRWGALAAWSATGERDHEPAEPGHWSVCHPTSMEERELYLPAGKPLIGWRLFRVRRSEDRFVLSAPLIHNPDFEHFPSPAIDAVCYQAEHAAPAPGCRCGLYAAIDGTLDSLSGYLRDSAHDRDPPIYAEVACTGRVFVDVRGVRAQRIEILRLAMRAPLGPVPGLHAQAVAQLRQRYGVEVCNLGVVPQWVVTNVMPQGAPPEDAVIDLDALVGNLGLRSQHCKTVRACQGSSDADTSRIK